MARCVGGRGQVFIGIVASHGFGIQEQRRDPKKMTECSRKVCPDLLWGWLCPSDALRTVRLRQEEANASGPGPLVQAPQLNQGQAVLVSAVPVLEEKQWI